MKERNGKIEFMRFVFSLFIILFHINTVIFGGKYKLTEDISFFSRGRIGVEFFFVVTGYFLAASAFKKQSEDTPPFFGKETIQFVWKKFLGIFPYHLIAFSFTFVTVWFIEKLNILSAVKRLVLALPNLFLFQKLGIPSTNLNGVEWYISCMLVASFILYPLCRKYYEVFTRIVAPTAGLLLVGYMIHVFGCLSQTSEWAGLCAKVLLRAIADMCFGIFAFEVARYIAKLRLSNRLRGIITCIEFFGYFSVLLFAVSTISLKYESYALLALALSVSLTMSGQTYGNHFFQNKVVAFLGRYSLPIYLSQMVALDIAEAYFSEWNIVSLSLFVLGDTLLIALVVMFLGEHLKNWMSVFAAALIEPR